MKKYVVIFNIVLLIGVSHVFSECWDVREINSFAFEELDGSMVFSFKDAVTCQAIKDVKVQINNTSLTTDANGYIKFSNQSIDSLMDGSIQMTAQKRGYCPLQRNVRVMAGSIFDKRFLMSKQLPIGKARFVLQWGGKPRDLDLHLVGRDFHISYRNMKVSARNAQLDRDDLDGYGPETITLENIISSQKYVVYVHNYSGEAPINDHAQVSVFRNNRLDKVVTLPRTTKPYVKILELKNNEIQYLNTSLQKIP